jgi:hypothetical protein
MANPTFDIDDLGFLRCFGLGLRHVGLKQGLREAKEGAPGGDAVSLANYGNTVDGVPLSTLLPTSEHPSETCDIFEKKIKDFVRESYVGYHSPPYTDAAFLLMDRGQNARTPFDFYSYPLGKCGSKPFSSDQVLFLISSDRYTTRDLDSMVESTLSELRERIKKLKLQKTEMLLAQLRNPDLFYESTLDKVGRLKGEADIFYLTHRADLTEAQKAEVETMLLKMIEYYQQDLFIPVNLFYTIEYLLNIRDYCSRFSSDNIPTLVEDLLSKLRELLSGIDQTIKIAEERREQERIQQTSLEHKLTHLYNQIDNLRSYGCQLGQTDKASSGIVIQLSNSLKNDVVNFFQQDRSVITAEFQFFRERFTKKLHEADEIINTTCRQLIANIAIALTGIGLLLLIVKLAYSGCKTGSFKFFFSDAVERQQQIDLIDNSLRQIVF